MRVALSGFPAFLWQNTMVELSGWLPKNLHRPVKNLLLTYMKRFIRSMRSMKSGHSYLLLLNLCNVCSAFFSVITNQYEAFNVFAFAIQTNLYTINAPPGLDTKSKWIQVPGFMFKICDSDAVLNTLRPKQNAPRWQCVVPFLCRRIEEVLQWWDLLVYSEAPRIRVLLTRS